jgi:hypothetical protein
MDNGGNTTTKSYLLQASDATEALASIEAIRTAMVAVSDSVVLDYGATQRFTNDAVTFPADGVQIENQAIVEVAILDEPSKTATFTIPAPKISVFVGTAGAPANVVDITKTPVINYSNLFKATTGNAFISDGETIDYMKSGRRIHRKSRKG